MRSLEAATAALLSSWSLGYSEHRDLLVWRGPDWKANLGSYMPLPPHSFGKNKAGVHFQSQGEETDPISDGKCGSPTVKGCEYMDVWFIEDQYGNNLSQLSYYASQFTSAFTSFSHISLSQEPWEVIYNLLYFHNRERNLKFWKSQWLTNPKVDVRWQSKDLK